MAKRKVTDEILEEEVVEKTVGEEEVIPTPPAVIDRIFVLDGINFCSIGEEVLTLTNPSITIKSDSELIKIAEILIKTKKIKEII